MSTELANNNLPNRHSFFQLKYFVIGKEPTLQGKMWQCIREIRSRKDALENIKWEHEELKDNVILHNLLLKEIDTKITQFYDNDSDGKLKLEVDKRKAKRQLVRMAKMESELLSRKKNTEEELAYFTQTLESIQKIEKLKPYDDLECQTEYWSAKLSEKLNLSNLFGEKPDMELVNTILALPDDAPIKKEVVYMIEGIQKQLLETKAKMEANKLNTDKED